MTAAGDPAGYLVVANAEAGSTERTSVGRALAVLADSVPVEVAWTVDEHDIDRAIEAVGQRRLVVAGGDGTIHLVVNRLDRAGRLTGDGAIGPVGLVPLGTGNDLARGLGLPLDPAEAAERIRAGHRRHLPLLRVDDGEAAVNNAHLGIGVDAARRGHDLKGRLGPLAYRVGAVAAGLRPQPIETAVEVDGTPLHDGPALLTLVALGPSAGGGAVVEPTVDLSAPRADVFVVTDLDVRERLDLVRRLVSGELAGADGVTAGIGRRIRITVPEPTEAEVDGEFRTWSDTTELAVEPRSWQVLA